MLPSADGQYLARLGPWASHTSQLAVAFYKNGDLQHEYMISDLVEDESKLSHTVSHFFWRKDFDWSESRKEMLAETLDGLAYTFGYQTGLLVEVERH